MALHPLPCFRQPFVDPWNGGASGDAHDPGERPWLVAELRMCGLSADIREKEDDWPRRLRNPAFIARWHAEGATRHLSPEEIDYVLEELADHVRVRDVNMHIEPSCFDRIWHRDNSVPSGTTQVVGDWINQQLSHGSHVFRNPKWPHQVFDFVHPSLYPWVAARTVTHSNYSVFSTQLNAHSVLPDATSHTFAWIATNYTVHSTAPRVSPSGYINNLRPDHCGVRTAIDDVIGIFVPLFERVLNDTRSDIPLPKRIPGGLAAYTAHGRDRFSPSPYSNHSTFQAGRGVQLAGRNVQIFVKLSAIYLTPEHPVFPGGNWQYSGIRNERIVACGVFCLEESNVDELELSFRTKVDLPLDLSLEQVSTATGAWGIDPDGPMNQQLPSTSVPQGRCIAFPNLYQHRIEPFALRNRSRFGHRVILSILLVDPNARVLSTSDVHPQQADAEWHSRCANVQNEPRSCTCSGVLSAREAQLFREQLEDERDNFLGVTQHAWAAERWTVTEQYMDSDLDSDN